jgi:hypothetical protein
MSSAIPLPNHGTAFEFAGIQYLLAQEFGREFFNLVDSRFRNHNVVTWFQQIQDRRALEKQPVYDDAKDPRFLLKEATFWNSEIRLVVHEVTSGFDDDAKKLLKTLNNWSHQKLDPTPEAFLSLLVQLESVCISLQLEKLLAPLDELIDRTKLIKNAVWVPTGVETSVTPEAADFADKVKRKVEEVKRRPPVGHEWIGKPGDRLIELSRATKDVYEDGLSIKHQLGLDADEKIASWLRYYPMGGRLRVDTDGAVLGFNQGVGYLIGWFGEDPNSDNREDRGFYLPNDYVFVENDIRDNSAELLLSEVAVESVDWVINKLVEAEVPLNTELNMSNYGDVTYVSGESGEELLIATLHKDLWFPGQLGERLSSDED